MDGVEGRDQVETLPASAFSSKLTQIRNDELDIAQFLFSRLLPRGQDRLT